jgi:hypothetical protein
MPDFPISLTGGMVLSDGMAGAPSSSASTHTKGSYTQLQAATSADATGLYIGINNAAATGRSFLVDIAVGAAASEQIILANLLIDQPLRLVNSLQLPCLIPAGSRIAARCQCDTGSQQITMAGFLIAGGLWGESFGGPVVTLGANTATSKGTTVDAGATPSTYGAWTTIEASTAADIAAINVRKGSNRNTAPVEANLYSNYLQIGVGAAAAEQVVARLPVAATTSGYMGTGFEGWLPVNIPAGSRVAARYLSNTADATDRIIDVQVLGLTP